MNLIVESTRKRVISLITKAYSTIHISDAAKLLGLSTEETLLLAERSSWSFEGETGYLLIRKPESIVSINAGKEGAILGPENGTELLEKLTDYILFLESSTAK